MPAPSHSVTLRRGLRRVLRRRRPPAAPPVRLPLGTGDDADGSADYASPRRDA